MRLLKFLLRKIDIIVDDRLKERSYGDWSAKNKEQVKAIEGEENYRAAKKRMDY